jgi:hypothetical protein
MRHHLGPGPKAGFRISAVRSQELLVGFQGAIVRVLLQCFRDPGAYPGDNMQTFNRLFQSASSAASARPLRFLASRGSSRPVVPLDLSADPIDHISGDPSRCWHHGSRVFLRDLAANDGLGLSRAMHERNRTRPKRRNPEPGPRRRPPIANRARMAPRPARIALYGLGKGAAIGGGCGVGALAESMWAGRRQRQRKIADGRNKSRQGPAAVPQPAPGTSLKPGVC